MRAALGRVDVVREREDGLDVLRVPLHRHLDLTLLALALEVDDVLVDGILVRVHMADEVADAPFVMELKPLAAGALVTERDAEPTREESRLAESLRKRVTRPVDLLEDLLVGHERDRRAALVASAGLLLQIRLRLAAGELLAVSLAVALDLDP